MSLSIGREKLVSQPETRILTQAQTPTAALTSTSNLDLYFARIELDLAPVAACNLVWFNRMQVQRLFQTISKDQIGQHN